MTPSILRVGVGLSAWAAVLAVVLSIANWRGDWGHSICGPWGCGPPLQALLACHLAWLVILLPPVAMLIYSARVPVNVLRRIGILLCVAAALFVAAVVIYERLAWWPSANEWQRDYFWHRCGFVLATMFDLPVAQVLLLGLYLHSQRPEPNVKQLTEPTSVRR